MRMDETFAQRVRSVIRKIPPGRVATYGQIALYAGNHRAARQVAWLLHSSSRKYDLAWHRVINSRGTISLKSGHGRERQRELLEGEGVEFSANGRVDFERFLWRYKR